MMNRERKEKVTQGVYWTKSLHVNLYIHCCRPSDSIQFLIKRGFIVSREENVEHFESFPNVILFSGILIKNGSYANISGFPVLQMLYNRALISSHHPNNMGLNHLLVGSEGPST